MTFYLGALALGLIACVFVLLPLIRGRHSQEDSGRTELNVALYQERVSELSLEEEAERLTLEAQKVLLSEVIDETPETPAPETGRNVFLVVAVSLPIFAGLIYLDVGFGQGSMPDVWLTEQMQNTSPADRTAYRRFLGDVETRAQQQPDDEDIQFLLARAYLNLDEYGASAKVMRELIRRYPEDPNLLSQYAEVLYLEAGRKVAPNVDEAIDEALRANPNDVTMMEIRAISAIEVGDQETARGWFQRALGTGITGRRAEVIRIAMNRLGSPQSVHESSGRSLQVQVSRAPDLELTESAVVFVFARAAVGPPAPLAVQRFPVSQLPVELTLDESMAMVPGMSLGTFDEVVVIARISQSGQVAPSAGDYEVTSEVINLSDEIEPLMLEITDAIL